MKIHTEITDIVGAGIVMLVIVINSVFDYLNSSTIQAIINAICAFLATILVKKILEIIKEKRQKNKGGQS